MSFLYLLTIEDILHIILESIAAAIFAILSIAVVITSFRLIKELKKDSTKEDLYGGVAAMIAHSLCLLGSTFIIWNGIYTFYPLPILYSFFAGGVLFWGYKKKKEKKYIISGIVITFIGIATFLLYQF